MQEWFGLPIYETLIPVLVWIIIFSHHIYLVRNHLFSLHFTARDNPSAYSFFAQMRMGWVKQNHLTGQAAANSTRDYLRVCLFYTGNAVLLGTITAGYTASSYKSDHGPTENLLTAKLGVVSVLFFVIFFVFIYAVRYGTHFHMMMNVKEVNGFQIADQLSLIEMVYHKSHFFFSTGVRLYFLLIPAFSWLISCWVMLILCPLHLFLVHQYDDLTWLQKDIDALFKKDDVESGGQGSGQELVASRGKNV
jgi:hypothetical protein